MKEPIKTIKERLFAEEVDPAYVAQLMADERSGVQKLITKYQNQQRKQRQMQEKYAEMSVFEQELYQKGLRFVAGLDEVGRGPLAGPVVAAAVVLPKNCGIIGLNDSKQLSAKKREELFIEIQNKAVAIGIGIADHEEIDRVNIYQASKNAMKRALADLSLIHI